jgi:hypothetical protein
LRDNRVGAQPTKGLPIFPGEPREEFMELSSFTYHGVNYIVKSAIETGENRFQVRTTDNKLFILQFNKNLYQWVISEAKMPT